MATISRWLNNRWILGLLILFALVIDGVSIGLNASEWASWVQAVGAIIAIVGAVLIAGWQNAQARADDLAQRRREVDDGRDAELRARALAVRNTVQVATYAMDSALALVKAVRDQRPFWEADHYVARIDHLRAVLDSMITPETEHLAVVSALGISQVLAQTHADIPKVNTVPLAGFLLDRCEKRVNEGFDFLARLIDLQIRMDDMCRARGMPLEINDFRPST